MKYQNKLRQCLQALTSVSKLSRTATSSRGNRIRTSSCHADQRPAWVESLEPRTMLTQAGINGDGLELRYDPVADELEIETLAVSDQASIRGDVVISVPVTLTVESGADTVTLKRQVLMFSGGFSDTSGLASDQIPLDKTFQRTKSSNSDPTQFDDEFSIANVFATDDTSDIFREVQEFVQLKGLLELDGPRNVQLR